MADKKVVLLSSWASAFGLRVQIALAEKQVDCKFKEENPFPPPRIELGYVYKKIPVLIHSGNPVCESSIIIQCIDEVWTTGPSLLPKDPLQHANARFWARLWIEDLEKQRRCSSCCGKRAYRDIVAIRRKAWRETIFGGETLGYVDIVLVPFSRWFYTYETFGGFTLRGSRGAMRGRVSPRFFLTLTRFMSTPVVLRRCWDLNRNS